MPYGPRWRVHRKLFNDFISSSTVKDHDVNQAKVVSNFLISLQRKPERFREHIHLCVVYPLAMMTRLTIGATSRLTGSLALSIAYGIRADTLDNEFLRMYEEMLGAAREALVPGTFLVDVLPFRKPDPLSTDFGRPLTCLSRASTSMVPWCAIPRNRSQNQGGIAHGYNTSRRTCCRTTQGYGPKHHTRLRAQTNLCTQSGGDIDPSIVSVCLENLEDFVKRGVSMEVICNTAGIVYTGRSRCTVDRYSLLTTSYRNVRHRASLSLPRARFSPPSRQTRH